ncbi:D-alanyl-D-alanine carboxypeptidase [Candidatus Shapirobacteria bacterium]|nr:D-alanyl-D-alanine carboxypeptidase [Candidatus Shapirobacteria bacterium]
MKKWLLLSFIFVFLVTLGTQFYFSSFKKEWINFTPVDEPLVEAKAVNSLTARSWLAVDLESGAFLGGKNIDIAFAPASLTKIVTALVAFEHYDLDRILVVGKEYRVGRHMGLVSGEKIKAVDLLSGLLIHSGNDAAYTLAGNYPGGEKAFVERMNQWVKERGFKRTHFVNFDGEEDENHYSTAADLAQLARLLWQNPVLRQMVGLEEKVVMSSDGRYEHRLQTTNELLDLAPEARGLKTGWTEQAGECFVGLFEIISQDDKQARFIITVVLGSEDRFGETLEILNWVKKGVIWKDHSATHSVEIAETKAVKP